MSMSGPSRSFVVFPQYGHNLKSGNRGFPHDRHEIWSFVLSSTFLSSFFRLDSSVFTFSTVSVSGWICLTSVLTLKITSLMWARVSLFDSTVSHIASSISVLVSAAWLSVVLCFLASERIWFRKVSTGFSKAIAQVMPQKVSVAAALIKK